MLEVANRSLQFKMFTPQLIVLNSKWVRHFQIFRTYYFPIVNISPQLSLLKSLAAQLWQFGCISSSSFSSRSIGSAALLTQLQFQQLESSFGDSLVLTVAVQLHVWQFISNVAPTALIGSFIHDSDQNHNHDYDQDHHGNHQDRD